MSLRLLSGTVLAILLSALPAGATQVFYVPPELMAQEADVVAHALVRDQQVRWDAQHQRILTLTTIEVLDGLKGARKGDRHTIYQVGGTLDGATFHIPGALTFTPGEQMLFFAMRYEQQLVSYGMGLGKYLVTEVNGERFVHPQFGDVSFVRATPDGWVPTAAPPAGSEPYGKFVARIVKALRGGR